ncbi:MAG TPA: NAD(P)H-binding protein [Actinomycetota bacterium]
MVTGASGLIGRRAVEALARTSPEVRAYVRRAEAAAALRSLGAKVAVGWIGDVDNLAAAMTGAHTVVHLVGALDLSGERAFVEANLDSVRAAVGASARAGIRRFVLLSYPGADPGSPNPYLRSKGEAERVVRESGLAFAIIRSTHVYGPGGAWLDAVRAQARRRPAVVIGSGRQILAPVFVDDVAAVLAAVDDRAEVRSGTWGLQGPDRVTADELADLLGAGGHRRVHPSPGRAAFLARLTGRPVGKTTLEILAADSVADGPDAAAAFGVRLTPLREGLAASLPSPPPGAPE